MQETKEKMSLDVSSFSGVVSHNPVISRGLFAPYHQQARDINQMLQSQMTVELFNQLKSLEERAVVCMKLKDKALEETMKRSEEMEIRLRKALAEAEFWRKMSAQKTDLCKDLAGRLLKVKKREMSTKITLEMNFAEEAQSSTGDNGDDTATARSRRGKRRRL